MNKYSYSEGYVPSIVKKEIKADFFPKDEAVQTADEVKNFAISSIRSMSAMCAAVYSACMQKLGGDDTLFEIYNIKKDN